MASIDRLRAVEVLIAVTDTGSFTAAASLLNLTPGAISKQIARLEDHLGQRLLHRTTRAVSLTTVGSHYVDMCRPLLAGFNAAEHEVGHAVDELEGKVKLSAPRVMGRRCILPAVFEFMEQWPKVSIETLFTERWVDMVAERVDFAIRIAGEMPDAQYVGKRVGQYSAMLVASPAYLKARGEPRETTDLSAHDGLMLSAKNRELSWDIEHDTIHPVIRFVAEDVWSLYEAAKRGLGIAVVPAEWVVRELESGQLVEVLPGRMTQVRDIWIVRMSNAYTPPVVSSLIEHLDTHLSTFQGI